MTFLIVLLVSIGRMKEDRWHEDEDDLFLLVKILRSWKSEIIIPFRISWLRHWPKRSSFILSYLIRHSLLSYSLVLCLLLTTSRLLHCCLSPLVFILWFSCESDSSTGAYCPWLDFAHFVFRSNWTSFPFGVCNLLILVSWTCFLNALIQWRRQLDMNFQRTFPM